MRKACYAIAALLVASGLFHLAVYAVDGGPWEGPVSWRKPVTFGLSFGITQATIAWVTGYVRLSSRTRGWLLGVFAAACVVETTLVTLQRWRGVPSHLNDETTFDALVARVLAAGGGIILVTMIWLAVAAFRANPATPPSILLAVRVGLGTLLVALAIGGVMIAQGIAMIASGDRQGAYLHMGALKPAHAVTMHAITVLPVLAWLTTFTRWSEALRVRVVKLAAAGYLTTAVTVVGANALGWWPTPAAVALAAVGVVVLGGAGVLTVANLVRRPVPAGIL